MSKTILLLPGDGIGVEIVNEVSLLLHSLIEKLNLDIVVDEEKIGGAAYDAYGMPITDEILAKAKKVDAILLGAVGGIQYEQLPRKLRPEIALLTLRSKLELFANFRPALLYEELIDNCSLKPELVSDLDLLIVRELAGGIYFGEPRGFNTLENNERQGYNTYVYSESEIARIAHLAFQAAQVRSKKLCSVDKANVLEATELWREVVTEIAQEYPDVQLSHMYIDNAVMQLIRKPKQFDVILSGNMFGDILSDAAAMLTGSIGMLPSASLDKNNKGLFEPVHGSAPDIAGQNKANPIATFLSLAMLFRFSLVMPNIADKIEQGCRTVLSENMRTADIYSDSKKLVSCSEMGKAITDIIVGNL